MHVLKPQRNSRIKRSLIPFAVNSTMTSYFYILLPLLISGSPIQSTSVFPEAARPTKSGYLPVTASPSPSLFYAFYEAQDVMSSLPDTPLLLWLEGGPGCSSMLGNLFSFGPWLLSSIDNITLSPNPFTWNRHFGLLFIDNPLGTGYSSVKETTEIPRDQSTIASHLLVALQYFLSFDNSFRSRPFYIAGESYGGKFVPSLGYSILRQNEYVPSNLRINLKGVSIGNGLTHPLAQVASHADSAYFIGLINEKEKLSLENLQSVVVNLIYDEKWKEASDARNSILDWLQNATGLATLYDFTRKEEYPLDMISEFLNMEEVKDALNVPKSIVFQVCSIDVMKSLHEDIMKSVKFAVEELVKQTEVLLYQGLYDLRDGVLSTDLWVKEIEWDELNSFLDEERKVWRVNGELFAYVQRFGSLSRVVLPGAGHFAAADQRHTMQYVLANWVMKTDLFGDEELGREM